MLTQGVAVVLAVLVLSGGVAAAEVPTRFEAGVYEILVRLELPNVQEAPAVRTVSLCLPAGGAPLPALSANNPFGGCSVRNLEREAGRLQYDLACQGRGSAVARAVYHLRPRGFDGRIAMMMGGKNMTMTEVQSGRRIGDCPPDGSPASPAGREPVRLGPLTGPGQAS